ncbi:MAG: apolipoprotein N-acyltransferase [Alphaproteobacteria bacterium]|nr:apolipoprotein N-acyltransferase [Alphaproteobacteria bacterium]
MKVFVDVHDERWNRYKINFEKIVSALDSAVYRKSEVSIILTDDDEIHEINKTYRNVDKPTNVLSFELGDDVLLGDIYISFDTVKREAELAKIPFENHVAHMVVHGVYHLMGLDHVTDDEAAIMEMKEAKTLQKLGIKNPYVDTNEFVCADGSCCPGAKMIAWLKRFEICKNGFWQYVLYAVFGGVAAFGFAPFYCWWATLVGVAGAYWLTVRNKNIGGFWRTFLRVLPFGAVYSVAMFWWVLHSIYVVPEIAKQFAIWTVPGVIGLAIAGALIFSWPFIVIAQKKLSSSARPFMFAVVWVLVLWAREWLFTGFPWNPIANITMPWPGLANSMSVWGALGLTFVIIGFVAAAVEFLRNRARFMPMVIFSLLIGFGVMLGGYNMERADVGADKITHMIRIVQPGENQMQKASHDRAALLQRAAENIRDLVQLTGDTESVDFVVLPETAYPFILMKDDVIEMSQLVKKPMIFGANTFDNGGLYNSMVIVDADGGIDKIYSKSHLVPFGEYSPLGILPSPANLIKGGGAEIINLDNFIFAPAICYEIVFSDSLVPNGAGGINAIVNITNDNWFGNTPGTYQHLDMVRRYAIESGLPIIRANYSGISAFIASDGEIISSLPVGARGSIDGFVWGAHKTPYRAMGMNAWLKIILGFSVLCIAIANKKQD